MAQHHDFATCISSGYCFAMEDSSGEPSKSCLYWYQEVRVGGQLMINKIRRGFNCNDHSHDASEHMHCICRQKRHFDIHII